ncbi:MAG: CYTH domain-containing protein [Ignavibacterium sp.]|nr:MAG: CYTH domain-containing protein [Ignavibacterium sp.]
MPTNLELKIKVESHHKFRNILTDIDADNIGVLNQKDAYYKVPDGLLKLRIENGKESLIFYRRDEKGNNRWSDFDVLKFESDGGEEFFNKIFSIETIVEKRRELFIYDNTRIHLDEVKSLGFFVELETLVLKGKEEAKVRFENIIKLLALDTSKQIRKSYRDLLLRSK